MLRQARRLSALLRAEETRITAKSSDLGSEVSIPSDSELMPAPRRGCHAVKRPTVAAEELDKARAACAAATAPQSAAIYAPSCAAARCPHPQLLRPLSHIAITAYTCHIAADNGSDAVEKAANTEQQEEGSPAAATRDDGHSQTHDGKQERSPARGARRPQLQPASARCSRLPQLQSASKRCSRLRPR